MTTTYSIQSLFGELDLTDKLYVVKPSNKVVVYVGKAGKQSVAVRMAHHILNYHHIYIHNKYSANKKVPSAFSTLLFKEGPACFNWKIEIFNIKEVETITRNKNLCLSCAERALHDHFIVLQGAKLAGNKRAPNKCKNICFP